jgi:hypothetical protein
VLRAAEAGVAVWSPHSALDAVQGGINDWVFSGLGFFLSFSISSSLCTVCCVL